MLARRSTEMGSLPMIREVFRDKAQRYALQQQCLYLPEKDSTGMQRIRRIVQARGEEQNTEDVPRWSETRPMERYIML